MGESEAGAGDEGRRLRPEQSAKLLGRLMLAWDGQWFLKTAESCGLERAVELNARVRASFGRIEIREYLKALGVRSIASVAEAVGILEGYKEIFLGEGMELTWAASEDEVSIRVTRCLPQEGAGRAGLRPDTPCVACESVWAAWLETALPGTSWRDEVRASMGRGAGSCLIVLTRAKG